MLKLVEIKEDSSKKIEILISILIVATVIILNG